MSYTNFNVANSSNILKVNNMKLGKLYNLDKVHVLDKGHHSESYNFGVMPFLNFAKSVYFNRQALTPHAMLLYIVGVTRKLSK
jgi:hypothetical protein